jgi:hypothetical protein
MPILKSKRVKLSQIIDPEKFWEWVYDDSKRGGGK